MMSFSITPFSNSIEYSLVIENFVPQHGYDNFLRNLCTYLEATFVDWYQGVESGIGHIVYRNYKLAVFWTDFPFSLSFDCQNEIMAIELQKNINEYMKMLELR